MKNWQRLSVIRVVSVQQYTHRLNKFLKSRGETKQLAIMANLFFLSDVSAKLHLKHGSSWILSRHK